MTFDWYPEARQHKRVILCDADQYKHVTVRDVQRALTGMGLCEWEVYMGKLFTEAISQAATQNANAADTTAMFSCELFGIDDVVGKYQCRQEKVIEFLMEKLFDKVSENENELTVKIKRGLFS